MERAANLTADDFRALADALPQMAWVAETSGDIIRHNRRWYDYTGTTLKQMRGWGWRDVHHPDHVERVVARIREAFRAGEPWKDTFPLRGADGEYRWFRSLAQPHRGPDGRILRWFGTNTDITERKGMEHRLARHAIDLRRSNEELEQFAHVASHDPKAPLRGIENLVGWIEEDLEGSLTGDVDVIDTAGMDLVRGTKPANGRGSTEPEPAEPRRLGSRIFNVRGKPRPFERH